MGKGMKPEEKFDEGGYMSFGASLESNIMLTNKEGGEATLPMSAYQKPYVQKLQVIMDNLLPEEAPKEMTIQQIIFYITLLREKPCSAVEVEQSLCVVSEQKGGYLKDELKMQKAFYSMEQSDTAGFYAYAASLVTGGEVEKVDSTNAFISLIYKGLYDQSSRPLSDVQSKMEERGIFIDTKYYEDANLTGQDVKSIVVQVLKGLLQNRKDSLQAQVVES